jgi:peptidoglycan hydrolase-like protein with peptidoglycan-binding domain
VADDSYLRPAGATGKGARRGLRRTAVPARRSGRLRYLVVGVLVLAIALVAAGAVVLVSARAKLTAGSSALAAVGLPTGGGTIESVSVTSGPHSQSIPVQLRGNQIWPNKLIPAHQLVSVDAVVKRPGWISWLAGSTEHVHLQLMTPSASLRSHFITLRSGAPLLLSFRQPVQVITYGTAGNVRRRVLADPRAEITVPRGAPAGSLIVAAAPRIWESAKPAVVSWFPAGAAAAAVATPAPGTEIRPTTPITLTFNKPISGALGASRPPVTPITSGTWHTLNSHTIVFRPQGLGFGLGSTIHVGLPGGVSLVGASGGDPSWRVPGGSPLRLQQLLAMLGYLPLKFNYAGPGVESTPQAEVNAAIHPPAGRFVWRYPNVPSALRNMWQPGASGVMTQGAVMAFENDHGLATVGLSNPLLWQYLIRAAVAGNRSTFGYTFVMVNEGSPESLSLWHSGHTVMSTPVNTGIPQAPTALGTYPVYEHIRVGTMSGTNPDGSHYDDPGIQFISYFNGGDALHAFDRAQFGFPQSLGCVEMELGPAGQVWPYTPIGTLVHVE